MLPQIPFAVSAVVAVACIVLGCHAVLSPVSPVTPVTFVRDVRRRLGGIVLALVGVVLAVLLAARASAAATVEVFVEPPGTTIDLTEVGVALVGVAAAALTVLGRVAVRALQRYLEHKAGLELDAETRAYLDRALERAVVWARLHVAEAVRAGAPAVDLRSKVLALSANYVLDAVPDALERFGLDADGDRLRHMLEARLAGLFGVDPFDGIAPAETRPG